MTQIFLKRNNNANSIGFAHNTCMKGVYRTIVHGKKLFLQAPTGTGKTLTSAAVIRLFLRSGNANREKAFIVANNRQRVTLIAKCEALKVDPQEILREAGWTEGQMTRKQYTDAMEILEELK